MNLKLVLLGGLLFTGSIALPQSTLTANNSNPVIGETFTYKAMPASAFAQGDSGMNITWTLFAGQSSTSDIASEAVDPSSMSQSANYPSANLGFFDADMSEGYWIANQDSLALLGGEEPANNGLSVNYSDDPWVFLAYPMTYGDMFTDQFAGSSSSNVGSPSTRTGEVTTTVDGYGDVVLPEGTVSGVLRVKTIATYRDSAFGIEIANYVETRYLWYAPDVHQPVVAMIRIEPFLVGIPSPQIVSVAYLADLPTVGITEPEALSSWKVFPNPTRDQVQVNFSIEEGEHISFSLMNNLGQTIEQQTGTYYHVGTHHHQWDLPKLSAGTYFLQLRTQDRVATQRLMIH